MIRASKEDKLTVARNILRSFGSDTEGCREWEVAIEALSGLSEKKLSALYFVARHAKKEI